MRWTRRVTRALRSRSGSSKRGSRRFLPPSASAATSNKRVKLTALRSQRPHVVDVRGAAPQLTRDPFTAAQASHDHESRSLTRRHVATVYPATGSVPRVYSYLHKAPSGRARRGRPAALFQGHPTLCPSNDVDACETGPHYS